MAAVPSDMTDGTIPSDMMCAQAVTSRVLKDEAVESKKIADTIQSDNFVTGVSGWQINRDTGLVEGFTDGAVPTYFIASSTSRGDIKRTADWTCDGTADDVQINLALAALTTDGGRVVLSAGKFYMNTNTTAVTIAVPAKGHLMGLGAGATLIAYTTNASWDLQFTYGADSEMRDFSVVSYSTNVPV